MYNTLHQENTPPLSDPIGEMMGISRDMDLEILNAYVPQ